MLDKFLFGNKQIPEMYFGNIPVAQVYFGNTLIWEKVSKRLVAGNQNVAIEYIPLQDEVVSSISIFTDRSPSGTTSLAKIIHESGLYIEYGTGAGGVSVEKYGLQGWLITVNLTNTVTLLSGHTYYIVLQGTTNDAFQPAYFENSTGNYKVPYTNTNASVNTSTEFNINGRLKPADYKGLVDTTGQSETIPNGIGALNEGAWFTWIGSQGQGDISLTPGHIYRRTNVDEGAFFTGAIGNNETANINHFAAALSLIYIRPNPSAPPVRVEQKLWKCYDYVWSNTGYGHVLAKNRVTPFYVEDGENKIIIDTIEDALSINVGDYFVWNGSSILTNKSYYYKNDDISYTSEIDFTKSPYSGYNDAEQLASVYKELNGTNKTVYLIKWADWKCQPNTLLSLPTGYTSYITSMTPVNPEDITPIDKGIYYLSSGSGGSGVYVYENNTYTHMNPWDNSTWKIDKTSVSSLFTNVPMSELFDDMGTVTDWLTDETGQGGSSQNQTAGESFVITPSYEITRKYYLEINGVEK